MNIHDKIVKCRSCGYIGPCDPTCCEHPDYDGVTAEEAWQAAIEADRKLTAKQLSAYESLVASLEAKCTHMRKMYDELKARTNPDLLASERAANAILTEELEADHKRRGEPVVLMREAALHLTNWLDKDECECEGPGHQCGRTQVEGCRDRLLAEYPQPAETSRGEPVTHQGYQLIQSGSLPPPPAPKAIQPAEPVRVPSDADLLARYR